MPFDFIINLCDSISNINADYSVLTGKVIDATAGSGNVDFTAVKPFF